MYIERVLIIAIDIGRPTFIRIVFKKMTKQGWISHDFFIDSVASKGFKRFFVDSSRGSEGMLGSTRTMGHHSEKIHVAWRTIRFPLKSNLVTVPCVNPIIHIFVDGI